MATWRSMLRRFAEKMSVPRGADTPWKNPGQERHAGKTAENRTNYGGRRDYVRNSSFLRVEDVADELGVSVSYAYKIIRKLNAELEQKGIITIAGRVNKQYFLERLCYGAAENKTAERR